MTAMNTRASLERLRLNLCRLVPEGALATLQEAERFLDDRGLLTLAPDSALPSLFGAAHEEPFAPGRTGFGAYPKTKWWWGGALGQLPGTVPTKLHRGKTLYLSHRTAALVDPLCRRELDAGSAGEFGEPARRILEHLKAAGPSLLQELKDELGLDAPKMRAARQKLEARGAASSVAVRLTTDGGGHTHSSRLSRWDQLMPASRATAEDALAELAVAGVRAAVITPRAEVQRWFAWRITGPLLDELLDSRRLVAYEGALAAFDQTL